MYIENPTSTFQNIADAYEASAYMLDATKQLSYLYEQLFAELQANANLRKEIYRAMKGEYVPYIIPKILHVCGLVAQLRLIAPHVSMAGDPNLQDLIRVFDGDMAFFNEALSRLTDITST